MGRAQDIVRQTDICTHMKCEENVLNKLLSIAIGSFIKTTVKASHVGIKNMLLKTWL